MGCLSCYDIYTNGVKWPNLGIRVLRLIRVDFAACIIFGQVNFYRQRVDQNSKHFVLFLCIKIS